MHGAQLLLGLAATVAAVDIRFYQNDQGRCFEGAWRGCANINPNDCCTVGGAFFGTAGVVAVPGDWTLTGNGYRGRGCEVFQFQAIGRGRDFCLGHVGSSYSGAFYWFGEGGRKRGELQKCESSHEATQLGLEDGSVYQIENLSEDEINEIVALANNGTTAADLPEYIQARRLV
ncbi:hypothetical protein HJFPF1_06357 [Paramyrothecium foliicola]|nr:hypothetical protein HJFPF1_06357 [Paramyrothecium foliicola]